MNNNNNKRPLINLAPYIFVSLFLLMMAFSSPTRTTSTNLNYREFNELVASEKITSAKVSIDYNTMTVSGVYKNADGSQHPFTAIIPNTEKATDELIDELKKVNNVTFVDANASNYLLELASSIIPLILFVVAGVFIMNRMGAMNSNKQAFDFSKSRARLEDDIRVRFDDVAGCDEEKEEMEEIIEYLKNPKKFAKMGARIPKGIIMVGPPGTGKTLLAKAVAGEANVPFYSISGSDFVEMFVGVGASRVRDMFAKAKKTAPCMIFIDEIDAVGRQRGAGLGGGHDEREQTLNQLLVELDGMADNAGVIVIAATNRPDVLDSALLRPGRFDRQITVSLPDLKGREAILKVHARNKKIADSVELSNLARRTPGFSGADLENVLNEAAILAVRENKDMIETQQIDEAIDRVMMGPAKKSRTYDDYTKKLVAYHEAGHAIVGLNLPDGAIVQKVTIIPRGNAGGYNLITPRKEKILNSRKELMDTITSYMGGRAAEEIFFGDVTTGASSDIQQATRIAKDMVTTYGMSDLGPIQYNSGNDSVFLGRDYNSPSNASSQVAYEIDTEVRKIIESCHQLAKKIIEEHKADLIKIADTLMEKETLTAEEIEELLKKETKEEVKAEEPVKKTVTRKTAVKAEPKTTEAKKEPVKKTTTRKTTKKTTE
ncbi:MAG: ATP-dependent zinc metalloprotease FtsH [Erysipelotrichaceae bacterium]|nr:ATP-dependent zinc metalloprotease FtsH [Erysipelotrichaceae bacterium]MBR6723936.1 ATP-dependent zinc metalloprotease FtsH [Erysipelotrichaceae bacterium]